MDKLVVQCRVLREAHEPERLLGMHGKWQFLLHNILINVPAHRFHVGIERVGPTTGIRMLNNDGYTQPMVRHVATSSGSWHFAYYVGYSFVPVIPKLDGFISSPARGSSKADDFDY